MKESPLVSVLMTAYNREKYIAEAIESVLASTYQNWELIVVDDGSKDSTVEIAKQYETKDKRIKVYINEKNLGDYPNRNKAASYAHGKYLKYLDSDDLIYPHGLSVMVSSLEKFPEAAYALSYSKPEDVKPYPIKLSPMESYKEHFLRQGLFNVGPSGLIFRTDLFREVGGFKLFKVYSDAEMQLRLSMNYPMVKMQPALIWWRQHDDQEFNIGHINNEYFNQTYNLNMSYLSHPNCPMNVGDIENSKKRLQQHHARKILRTALNKRMFKTAWNNYKVSNMNIIQLLKGLKPYE